ncbi:uncharacterized protein LOC121039330 [Herpailurus yagouaroundi]|uniref:uncharacterized protein LOC121039330 n=1 Tax=Herpailurus yagouaroundi TaxID=1608482 RepID=UPI001AD610DD|nr:uncharacterized protein LOC121039330 [Puma yagouaroundi]
MQLNWPNEKTKDVAPSPLSNYLLPGAQFDCHHCCQRHLASSASGTQPYRPSCPPNHMALLPPSPARGVHYSSFPPPSPLPHQNPTQVHLTGGAQVTFLCSCCKRAGEGRKILSSNLVELKRENPANIRKVFKIKRTLPSSFSTRGRCSGSAHGHLLVASHGEEREEASPILSLLISDAYDWLPLTGKENLHWESSNIRDSGD